MEKKRKVIVALDFPTVQQAVDFLDLFPRKSLTVKVGMELFYAAMIERVNIINLIETRGHEIFLDLKLCDIPTTVYGAMVALKRLNVSMINIHAFGGVNMMRKAMEGLKSNNTRPLLLAVTVLTSINQQCLNEELLVNQSVEKTVLAYARNAKAAGVDGIIASAKEAKIIRENLGENFLIITPGVRFKDDAKDDQQRVVTPEMAKELGVDHIVMGRSITRAKNPRKAYERAVREFCN